MKTSAKILSALTLSSMLLVAGCSTAETLPDKVSASAQTKLAGTVVNGVQTKTQIANDGKGDYLQSTVSDTDASMSKITEAPASAKERFTDEEITNAKKFVVRFTAEEIIDSTLVGNDNDEAVEKWWAANKDKFVPEKQDAFYNALKKNDHRTVLGMRNTWLADAHKNLAYGSNKTHIADRALTVKSIEGKTFGDKKALVFKIDSAYSVISDDNGQETKQAYDATIITAVIPDGQGGWLINGVQNTFTRHG